MKNKKLSWVLLPVVIAIWAVIGWKVYASLSSDEDQVVSGEINSAPVSDRSNVPDTYELSLNYRDPFLGAASLPKKNTKKTVSQNTHPKDVVPVAPVQKEIPVVQYFGLVKEKTSDKTVGFLRVNGESFFVKQNDQVGEVFVLRLWPDSVEIRYDAKKSIVRK